VAVVGFDLRSLEDADAVLVLEVAIVAVGVELTVLREHEAVDRQHVLLLEQPLQVADHGGSAVFGFLRMCVQVENHVSLWNFGNAKPSSKSSNTTSTGMPILTTCGSVWTMLVRMRGPSSS